MVAEEVNLYKYYAPSFMLVITVSKFTLNLLVLQLGPTRTGTYPPTPIHSPKDTYPSRADKFLRGRRPYVLKPSNTRGLPLRRSHIFRHADEWCWETHGGGEHMGYLVDTEITFSGIGLQVILSSVFVLCAVMFRVRTSKRHFARMMRSTQNRHAMLSSLYTCNVLIAILNVYRLVEYGGGQSGYLQTQVWLTYFLDVGVIAIVTTCAFSWYLPDAKGEHVEAYPLIALSDILW
ncbi:RTA1 like protein-domain-containing protein [Penicillium frequentans]|nr:RTA1 like protein-domain-containing protein [Penicillium glabrum]